MAWLRREIFARGINTARILSEIIGEESGAALSSDIHLPNNDLANLQDNSVVFARPAGASASATAAQAAAARKAFEEHHLPPINPTAMTCCICNPLSSVYGLPNNRWAPVYGRPSNTICPSCYDGAKAMIAFLNEADDGAAGRHASKSTNMNAKGICHGFKRMKEREKNLEEKVGFLDAVSALREGILTDIMVKPGKGSPIPAHRAVLVTKSQILRTMLPSDDCKAAAEDSISLPELSHDELKCLLEFLYSGSLPAPPNNDSSSSSSSSSSLYYSLLIASDKYDIPFLRKECRRQILAALHASNVIDALEVALVCSDAELKEQAMSLIVDHAEEVVFSAAYEEFATKNAHLSVHITRALLTRKAQLAKSATNYGY